MVESTGLEIWKSSVHCLRPSHFLESAGVRVCEEGWGEGGVEGLLPIMCAEGFL